MKLCRAVFCFLGLTVVSSERIYSPDEERVNERNTHAIISDVTGRAHVVNLRPSNETTINVTLDDFNVYFYSPEDPNIGIQLSPHDFNGTIPSDGFDPTKKSIFVSAGWAGKNTSGTPQQIRAEVMMHGGANMFVLDWSRIANEFYTVVVQSIPELGLICGDFIDKMLDENQMDATRIMLIGESVGAHLVGACGAAMKKRPGIILGLDPTLPLYYIDEPENRLSVDDGDVVHVVHTNKGFSGFVSSIGHADFYANGGGIKQPGCGLDIFSICAHHRAPRYYEESINFGEFISRKCDSYQEYLNGTCEDNEVSHFGGFDLDLEANGDYYFNTNEQSPFAMN